MYRLNSAVKQSRTILKTSLLFAGQKHPTCEADAGEDTASASSTAASPRNTPQKVPSAQQISCLHSACVSELLLYVCSEFLFQSYVFYEVDLLPHNFTDCMCSLYYFNFRRSVNGETKPLSKKPLHREEKSSKTSSSHFFSKFYRV